MVAAWGTEPEVMCAELSISHTPSRVRSQQVSALKVAMGIKVAFRRKALAAAPARMRHAMAADCYNY